MAELGFKHSYGWPPKFTPAVRQPGFESQAPPLIYSHVMGRVPQHADFYLFICKLEIIMVLK